MYFIIQQRSRENFNLLILLRFKCNNFVALAKQNFTIPDDDDDDDALKHVGVLTIYRIFLMYCYAFFGLHNKYG